MTMILDDYDPDRPWNKLRKPVYRLYQPYTGTIWDESTDLARLEAIQEQEAGIFNLEIIEIGGENG